VGALERLSCRLPAQIKEPAAQIKESAAQIKELAAQIKESSARIKESLLLEWRASLASHIRHTSSLIRAAESLI